jgi:hypothetical protein
MTVPIPVSTVDAFRTALLAAILADPGITADYAAGDINVCVEDPGTNQPEDLIVIAYDVEQTAKPYSMVGGGGAGWLDEKYTVKLVISVFRGGDSTTIAQARATALQNSVDNAIRLDPSLGGVVDEAYPSRHKTTTGWDSNHEGRMVNVDVEITVSARI